MMRQKFDQQWSVRKTHASEAEQARAVRVLRQVGLTLEAHMEGPTLSVEDLLGLKVGHVLVFDFPVSRAIELLVNGAHKFTAHVVCAGRKRACQIESVRPSGTQGRTSDDPESAVGAAPS
jgi:flagellar motor switch protein FliM